MMSSSVKPSLLTSLLGLITSSTQTLQDELNAAGLPEPWIDIAALHPWDEVAPSKKYWDARKTLISALGMMAAVVQNPKEKLIVEGLAYHHPVALNFVANTHIADILSEPEVEGVGLPISEIARRAGTHVAKTERVLCFLCVNHVFQETAPAVFANNKVSMCLKTGHPTADMPLFWGDIGFRTATALSKTLRAPHTAHSVRIEDAAFGEVFTSPIPENGIENMLLGSKATIFEFLARPSSVVYQKAFAQTMVSLETMNGTLGHMDFPWSNWDVEGAVFVEAGASKGHLSLSVLPNVKHARFVNQDLPEVCVEGEQFFAERNPEAITSGRVTFQPNDFFKGQPVTGATIYILSNILHDWPNVEALSILKHIAGSMMIDSRLLVIEIVILPAVSQSRFMPPTENLNLNDAPWPLLKDYGIVNNYAHHQSMEIINLFNGLDRTLDEYIALFEQAGLQLVQVHRIRKLVSIMELKRKD